MEPGKHFEANRGNGNGNGYNGKKQTPENAGEVFRSRIGVLLSEMKKLEREIYVAMDALAVNPRGASEVDEEEIKRHLGLALEELVRATESFQKEVMN